MKKRIIIIIVSLLVVLGGTVGVVIGVTHKNNEKQNKLDIKDWKDRYFYFLKSHGELNPIEIGNVGFLDSKISDTPIMYVEERRTDEEDSKLGVKYYYIKDNSVEYLGSLPYDECADVEFLYNSEKNEYAYYSIGSSDGEQSYDLLEYFLQGWTEYKGQDDFGQKMYNVNESGFIKLDNGTEIYKDNLFVDPQVEELFFKFTKDKNEFRKKLDNYKKQDELITDEVKQLVEDNLNNSKENSSSTENENNQSSASSSNIKVGTYTLQYGRYRACFNGSSCREFTLNSDGTAIVEGVQKYFRVENYNFGQGVEDALYPAIVFSNTEGGSPDPYVYTPYVSTPDCLMTDGEMECVNYVG